MNQEQAIPFNLPEEQEEEQQELLLLQETASGFHSIPDSPCTTCAYNNGVVSSTSHKRPSSEPPTTAYEPNPKKPNNRYHGFSKILLPSTTTRPVLRRCISDPLQGAVEPPHSPPQNPDRVFPDSPTAAVRTSAANLPPRPQVLRRSLSDLIPSPAKSLSRSSSSGEMMGPYRSDDVKSLKMMRDLMSNMAQWCSRNIPDEEDYAAEEINTATTTTNDIVNADENNNAAMKENCEEESVEAVSVERTGDCLIIHFKCPCGKGYQILLSGRNCYYKLL